MWHMQNPQSVTQQAKKAMPGSTHYLLRSCFSVDAIDRRLRVGQRLNTDFEMSF